MLNKQFMFMFSILLEERGENKTQNVTKKPDKNPLNADKSLFHFFSLRSLVYRKFHGRVLSICLLHPFARSSQMVQLTLHTWTFTLAGMQVAQWDFQNKGRSRWTWTSCFASEVASEHVWFCTMWPYRAMRLFPRTLRDPFRSMANYTELQKHHF